jgi:predicted phage terminase large subunit-like protein
MPGEVTPGVTDRDAPAIPGKRPPNRIRNRAPVELPDEERIAAERARRSFPRFVRYAWPVVSPAAPFVDGWMVDAVGEHLQAVSHGQIRDLAIAMPPRCGKSSFLSVLWPVWEWITWPHLRYISSSYALKLSTRDTVRARRLIQSPWFRARYGTRFALAGDQNTKGRYDNDRGGYRIATSVDAGTTGEGGDRILFDDPHSVRKAESAPVREGTVEYWRDTLSNRAEDPRTVARVIAGQRTHFLDLIGALRDEGGWEILELPMEYEPARRCTTSIGWTDPRTVPGELLWEGRFGPAEVAKLKKSMTAYAVAAQLQQHPVPREGGILKRKWWRFHGDSGRANVERTPMLEEFERIIASWDCTFRDSSGSDYVVGLIVGCIGAKRYILDRVRGRMGIGATKRAVRFLHRKWQPEATYVELAANGFAVVEELGDEIEGIVGVSWKQGESKEARANAVAPQVEAGQVYLPELIAAPWVAEFIEELAAFPKGEHDDQVDAFSMALIRARMGAFAYDT